MPDNFTNIDKKFTDRAWNEMSKMLDAEMPTTASKRSNWRRYLLLFILLMAGIGAVFGWRAAFGDFEKNEDSVETERPIANNEDQNFNNHSQNTDNQLISSLLLDTKTNEFSILESGSRISDAPSFSKSSAKNQYTKSKNPIAESDQTTMPAQKNIANSEDLKADNLNQIYVVTKAKKSQKFSVPYEVKSLALNPVDISSDLPVVPNLITPKANNKKPDFVKIKFGDVFHPIETVNGLSMGLAVEYSLKNKKFGVETGAFYDFIATDPTAENKQIFARTTADELVLTETSNGGSFGGLPNNNSTIYGIDTKEDRIATISELRDQDTSGTYLPFELPMRLHYLKFPVEFYYKINQKWRVKSGLNIAVLLTTPSAHSGGVLKSNANGGFDFELPSSADHNPSPAKVPVKSIDIGASLGVSYLVTNNLELGLNYNFGMLDHLNLKNLNSFNRYFQLNFSYNFNLNK